MALTPKQQRFCDEYLIDLNATQAAIRAGYSEKTAYSQGQRMLKNVEVKAYIEAELEHIHNEKTADAKEVMEYLTSVMRGQARSSVVVVENIGDFTSKAREMEKFPDEKERLKAAELLGKAHLLFADRVQQEVDMDLNITVDYGDDE